MQKSPDDRAHDAQEIPEPKTGRPAGHTLTYVNTREYRTFCVAPFPQKRPALADQTRYTAYRNSYIFKTNLVKYQSGGLSEGAAVQARESLQECFR